MTTKERRTCPECNALVVDGKCTNTRYCLYRGKGWSKEQRIDAWARQGVEEHTVGAQYDYTGRV